MRRATCKKPLRDGACSACDGEIDDGCEHRDRAVRRAGASWSDRGQRPDALGAAGQGNLTAAVIAYRGYGFSHFVPNNAAQIMNFPDFADFYAKDILVTDRIDPYIYFEAGCCLGLISVPAAVLAQKHVQARDAAALVIATLASSDPAVGMRFAHHARSMAPTMAPTHDCDEPAFDPTPWPIDQSASWPVTVIDTLAAIFEAYRSGESDWDYKFITLRFSMRHYPTLKLSFQRSGKHAVSKADIQWTPKSLEAHTFTWLEHRPGLSSEIWLDSGQLRLVAEAVRQHDLVAEYMR